MARTKRPICAACNHLSRKCGARCYLAPYFPPGREKQFSNAHKLFGTIFITNTVKNAPPNKKKAAANALVEESGIFARDPGGCLRIATELERMVRDAEYEYCRLLQRIIKLREDELKYVRNQTSAHHAADAAADARARQCDLNQTRNLESMMPKFTTNDHDQYNLEEECERFVQELILDPILEGPNATETSEFEVEIKDTVEQSDRDVLNGGRVISEEMNAVIQHVQDHGLESAAT